MYIARRMNSTYLVCITFIIILNQNWNFILRFFFLLFVNKSISKLGSVLLRGSSSGVIILTGDTANQYHGIPRGQYTHRWSTKPLYTYVIYYSSILHSRFVHQSNFSVFILFLISITISKARLLKENKMLSDLWTCWTAFLSGGGITRITPGTSVSEPLLQRTCKRNLI